MRPTIVLMTDFGLKDTYVGVMKGVMTGIVSDAILIDLTHGVSPQNVREAAYNLLTSYSYFPEGTIFCCVVDPGVGSARRAVAVRTGERIFVCPDNGMLTPILDETTLDTAVSLENERYHLATVSATFHGRDVFSPVAAHLAGGVPLPQLGPRIEPETLVRIEWPQPTPITNGWNASIVHADHFGNLITNVRGEQLKPPLDGWLVNAGPIKIHGIDRSFADVSLGEPVAYVGSTGYLELGVRQGNAQRQWTVGPGTEIRVRNIKRGV